MPEITMERILIAGEEFNAQLERFDNRDIPVLRNIFRSFMQLRNRIKALGDVNHTAPPIPATLTEGAFALFYNCPRIHTWQRQGIKKSDNYDPATNQRIQVKAMSRPSPTSFGPTSVFDRLIFLDFWRGGRLDGSFDVYDIPINLIFNVRVNQTQTMQDQQLEARRPRLNMHNLIITPNHIPILATHNLMQP